MKNLELMGVQELDANFMMEMDGGCIGLIVGIGLFILVSGIGATKAY